MKTLDVLFLTVFIIRAIDGISDFLKFNEDRIKNRQKWNDKLRQLRHAAKLLSHQRSQMSGYFNELQYHQKVFDDYLMLFERKYKNDKEEYYKRFHVFLESLSRHEKLNRRERELNGTARYGINKFTDWTPQEFQTLLKNKHVPIEVSIVSRPIVPRHTKKVYSKGPHPMNTPYCSYENVPGRNRVDWRSTVSRIKDQGECGSCWAFVSSEQIESYWKIKGNPILELSPQELISCSDSLGCEGGNTCAALNWLVKNQIVLATEKEYPYEEKDSSCRLRNETRKAPLVKALCGCRRLVGMEDIMLKVVDQKGPLSVNVDAVLWHDYIDGIIQHHCTNTNMNHAVQIVGYNLEGPVAYWIARNQWGISFGENGYVNIKYGKNVCGIAEQPSFIEV